MFAVPEEQTAGSVAVALVELVFPIAAAGGVVQQAGVIRPVGALGLDYVGQQLGACRPIGEPPLHYVVRTFCVSLLVGAFALR